VAFISLLIFFEFMLANPLLFPFYQYPAFVHRFFPVLLQGNQVIIRTLIQSLAIPVLPIISTPVHLVTPAVKDGYLRIIIVFQANDDKPVVPSVTVRRNHVRNLESGSRDFHRSHIRPVPIRIPDAIREPVTSGIILVRRISYRTVWIYDYRTKLRLIDYFNGCQIEGGAIGHIIIQYWNLDRRIESRFRAVIRCLRLAPYYGDGNCCRIGLQS